MRRLALLGGIVVLAAGVATSAPPGEPLASERLPEKSVTLGKGSLWKSPWRIIAFHKKGDIVCETLIRGGEVNICSNVPSVPAPILIPATFTSSGPKPTTFAVVAVTEEVARIEVRLAPGRRTLAPRLRSLTRHESVRSGLPRGFRFALVSVPKVRGLKLIRAFDRADRLVGRLVGSGPII